jgi:hypothetical protein
LLAPGTIVAGCRIDGTVGKGGMGTVYRATQLSLNRVVALKVLAGELSDDPDFRTRFQREGQLQAGLDHLHIVTVYEAGQTDQGLFLVMQLVSGPTLKELIVSGRLDPRRSLRLLMQVARALDAAHSAGLTHRDVKPHNILIGGGDHAYLADFGLTKAPDTDHLTSTGQFIGTIDYVAPEQIRGEGATAASDIYALAGVMYECLTGQAPFSRPTEAGTLFAHLSEPPPRVSERRPDLPTDLDQVIATGLAKDPAQRPESAAALVLAATRTLTPHAPAGPRAPASETIAARSERTRPAQVQAVDPGATVLASATPAPALAPVPTVPEEAGAGRPVPAGAGSAPTVPAGAGARPVPAGAAGASTGSATATRPVGGRRAGILAVATALVLAAVAGGYLAGHGGSGGASASFTNSASAGAVELSFPDGWQRSAASTGIPGLTFSQPLTLAAAGPTAGTLTLGLVDGSGPTLLPASFRARLQGTPASPDDPVALATLQAYRYTGLRVKGLAGALTIYAIPTSAGVATVACHADAPAGGFLAQCDRVAATLRLSGVQPYALGPNPAYAKALAATLSGLRADEPGLVARLRGAGSAAAQASAADALAGAYQRASSELGRTGVDSASRDANAALLAALAQLASSYSRAATAARTNDATAYASADREITRARGALTGALSSLRALGYSIAG